MTVMEDMVVAAVWVVAMEVGRVATMLASGVVTEVAVAVPSLEAEEDMAVQGVVGTILMGGKRLNQEKL